MQCEFMASYSGFIVPISQNMTLLPCTSPYSFGLVVSSTAFGGDLLNGVYSENSTASFTAFGFPADVFITVVQQEFGVTLAVSVVVIWYCCAQH